MKGTPLDCDWCAYQNRTDANYCGDCGRKLQTVVACQTCGFSIPEETYFCVRCGATSGNEEQPGKELSDRSGVALESPAVTGLNRSLFSGGAFVEFLRLKTPVLFTYYSASGLIFVLILAVALVLRVTNLQETPPNVTSDEADNLQVAYHILAGNGPGFFGLDWKPAPAFSIYLIAGSMSIFGESIVALRIPSVLFSVAAIAGFYIVARQVISNGAALAAMFLMATGLWFLHFSRSGWENAHVATYVVLTVLTLKLALSRGQWYLYALVGVSAGLGVYGYMGGRAIIVGVLSFLPFAFLLYPETRKRILVGYAVMLVVFFVLVAPQAKTAFDDWDYFNRRTGNVSVLGRAGGYGGNEGLPTIIAHQVWRTIDGFLLMDSGIHGVGLNGRYIAPGWAVLDRITGLLFWFGIICSLRRWRTTILWWVMFSAMLFPVQVLSTGTPDVARAVGAIPFYYLFVGLGLHWLLSFRGIRRKVSQFALMVLVIGIGFYNVTQYHQWMSDPLAATSRQPAVEIEEFGSWQRLQMEEAEAGRYGFNVTEWHQMRGLLAP
ncbi:MAG: glycosyltransferase family 39 protein [SAR202 cluster bacterium]|nr:glycosyltransferase family 39 protein [SAR202 cluster bacterium]